MADLFERYYEDNMRLNPISATYNGDNRYNNILYVDFTESFRDTLRNFYNKYLTELHKFNPEEQSANDAISYNCMENELSIELERLNHKGNYTPANQFTGLPLTLGQLASGESAQPFATVEDYKNWLGRIDGFSRWVDSAIVYYKKGMDTGIVLPKALVVRMVPQLRAMVTGSAEENLYYSPLKKFPTSFSDSSKAELTSLYINAINNKVIPAHKKLADFIEFEYLPKSRTTTGLKDVPGGLAYYTFLAKYYTTTNKTPEEIFNTGLAEVKRIRAEMEAIREQTGFKGDLKAFFTYVKTDKKFTPYKTDAEVLNAFKSIQQKIDPNLSKMFSIKPKTPFEIRQTEEFREASASAEYNQGLPDGSRPGIFYVPIVDPTKYNTTSGMESVFLHEAIPGHHYQISIQQENEGLPKFRRFGGNGAYAEGWALYTESLGKELGLYTDPYQYLGALGDEIHRAIRLVVDVGMHTKGWTREQAIAYMQDNEAANDQYATMEIERYMAIPGQALSYKIGSIKIKELRKKYEKQLGSKFSLADFHTEFLKDGNMPLELVEKKMDIWAKGRE